MNSYCTTGRIIKLKKESERAQLWMKRNRNVILKSNGRAGEWVGPKSNRTSTLKTEE